MRNGLGSRSSSIRALSAVDVEQEVAHLVTLEGVDQVAALDDLPAGVEMQVSPRAGWKCR